MTPRESEVLAVLAEGGSNAGIAAQLVVSEPTVDAHLRAIFVKLGLRQVPGTNRRVQAARVWLDHVTRHDTNEVSAPMRCARPFSDDRAVTDRRRRPP
ncbi:response regulator transcription factor [Nonomuraea bangladeshensis]|uniref:response regulator transcription factor n=1 Tax=Nonomuraea bangladeshensis TaxID=404385 RepID=UPI003C305C42